MTVIDRERLRVCPRVAADEPLPLGWDEQDRKAVLKVLVMRAVEEVRRRVIRAVRTGMVRLEKGMELLDLLEKPKQFGYTRAQAVRYARVFVRQLA